MHIQTQNDFAQEFSRRAPSEDIAYGGVLYDVIWSLAIALNETISMIDEGNTSINGTGCEGLPGLLVPLEEFSYDNELMGCLIQRNLQWTNFSGVSVSKLNYLFIADIQLGLSKHCDTVI